MNNASRGFGSDNNSGVHPAVMEAIQAANVGHVPGYGDDPYTQAAIEAFRGLFGEDTEVFLVFCGTGANVVGLSAGLASYEAVICARSAHINVDECGALERFAGCKLIDLDTPDSKLRIEQIEPELRGVGDVHVVQPRILSITQPTERGTLYQPDEIQALANFAHAHGMLLYMDGARISNAAAALDIPVRAFTRDAGVDILSFGGTKNGMMYGEAILLFRPELAARLAFLRKQSTQLASKMRYISAQFCAMLADNLWLRNARHANFIARLLAREVQRIPGVTLRYPSEANFVFARLPKAALEKLQERFFFYLTDDNEAARWMTSFDTQEQDVEGLLSAIREVLG